MKCILALLALLVSANIFAHEIVEPPHLDLEMSSAEYENLLKSLPKIRIRINDPAIEYTIEIGTRLSKWIALVNAQRTPETAIRLTSATTRRGIPIDKPNSYSPSIIKREIEAALAQLPQDMKDVLLNNVKLPTTIPLDDETFIKLARLVDRQYQSAARYKSVNQYRSQYINRAYKDVRGHHYLTTNNIGIKELSHAPSIPAEKIDPIKDALVNICLNSYTEIKRCKTKVDRAFMKNTLVEHYSTYFPASKKIWDAFFKIPVSARRRDIKWTSDVATVPFNTPNIPKFIPYLQDNIEDEFRFNNWAMKINFGHFPFGPLLKFEPGVVPHVNGLGGNEIVMDSNQPIEEYESQWTIRHEFGHVLGLPDCYHEFYDVNQQAYVNYQLDITDLMCSRAGNMNERIYLELKRAYEK